MEKDCFLPSLKEMSLCKLAQELYYHQANSLRHCTDYSVSMSIMSRDTCKFVKQKLNLPRCLEPLLQQRIQFVEKELSWWITHIFIISAPYFPHPNCNRDVVLFRPCIVWDSDGYINYEKTAVNLLAFPKLDRSKKYAIICAYCMEDEFEKFWTEDSCEVLDDRILNNTRLMSYWNCVRQNDFENFSTQSLSRNELYIEVLKSLTKWQFVAVAYFWYRLSYENQFQNVRLCSCPKVLSSWLEMLNETNLREVVEEKLCEILMIYTTYPSYPKYVYWLWTFIRDIISGDKFVKLLLIVKRSVDVHVEKMNFSTSLLIDIWSTSSLELKRYAFQYNRGSCIYNICSVLQRDMNNLQRDDRIIPVILSDASPEFRNTFWQNECVKYLVGDKM